MPTLSRSLIAVQFAALEPLDERWNTQSRPVSTLTVSADYTFAPRGREGQRRKPG
jgi:hypothetical protein